MNYEAFNGLKAGVSCEITPKHNPPSPIRLRSKELLRDFGLWRLPRRSASAKSGGSCRLHSRAKAHGFSATANKLWIIAAFLGCASESIMAAADVAGELAPQTAPLRRTLAMEGLPAQQEHAGAGWLMPNQIVLSAEIPFFDVPRCRVINVTFPVALQAEFHERVMPLLHARRKRMVIMTLEYLLRVVEADEENGLENLKTELRLAREPEAQDDRAAAIMQYFSPGFDRNPDGFVFVDRKVLWSLPDAHRTDVQRKERQGLLFALNLALERHRGW